MSAQVGESVGVYLKAGEWYWLLGYIAGQSSGLTSTTLDNLRAAILESMK